MREIKEGVLKDWFSLIKGMRRLEWETARFITVWDRVML